MSVRRALAATAVLLAGACGGSAPTTPSAPAPIPAADVCAILGGLNSSTGQRIGILSGADCSGVVDRSPVVRLNMRDAFGNPVGSCTGTIVLPRVVLTAAHCLDGDVREVRVWLGIGPEIIAASSVYHPSFTAAPHFDVGVVLMDEDLPRTPVSILTSRQVRIGEAAIIAGWGRDEHGVTTALRGGSTTISSLTASSVESKHAPPSSSVCSGDSGGPLLVSEGGRWVIAAVTSATSQNVCNTGTNFYAAVHHAPVRDFIRQHAPGVSER